MWWRLALVGFVAAAGGWVGGYCIGLWHAKLRRERAIRKVKALISKNKR